MPSRRQCAAHSSGIAWGEASSDKDGAQVGEGAALQHGPDIAGAAGGAVIAAIGEDDEEGQARRLASPSICQAPMSFADGVKQGSDAATLLLHVSAQPCKVQVAHKATVHPGGSAVEAPDDNVVGGAEALSDQQACIQDPVQQASSHGPRQVQDQHHQTLQAVSRRGRPGAPGHGSGNDSLLILTDLQQCAQPHCCCR